MLSYGSLYNPCGLQALHVSYLSPDLSGLPVGGHTFELASALVWLRI